MALPGCKRPSVLIRTAAIIFRNTPAPVVDFRQCMPADHLLSRRSLLATSTLAGCARIFGAPQRPLGVQLYTVRDIVMKQPRETLEAIAGIGYRECAGINRHVVGNERVLQERRKRLHLGLESCGGHREVLVEA
jgi:hypothetical protein